MVIISLQLERIPFDHQIHLFVWRSNGYENQGKGYGKALIDFLASKYADEYSEFLYGQLWSPNLWVWCTVNRYGIFAKMFITSNLEGGTAMLRKLNCFLNIVIGSFIGVFIGFGIYKFWHFKTYPNLYAMQSAPWYTELLLDGALVAVVVVVCIILKLIIRKNSKP